jgi:hypothetical protein
LLPPVVSHDAVLTDASLGDNLGRARLRGHELLNSRSGVRHGEQ